MKKTLHCITLSLAMRNDQTAEEAIASISDNLHGKTVEEIAEIVNEVKQNLRNK